MGVRIAAAAAGLVAAAVLAGCSGGDGGGTASSAPAGGSSVSAGGSSSSGGGSQAAGTPVQVEAEDFTLKLSTTTFSPGEYTFQMTNDGDTTHAIQIDGPGVEDQGSDTAGPGGTASVTVNLKPGKYTIYCPVANHRAMGMQTTFTVG